MGVRIEYYRPRGVAGNYKVKVILNLLPSERAVVFYNDNVKKKDDKNFEMFFMEPAMEELGIGQTMQKTPQGYICEFIIIKGGYVAISISDEQVLIGDQVANYMATDKGLEYVTDLAYSSLPDAFHHIELIDKGSTS